MHFHVFYLLLPFRCQDILPNFNINQSDDSWEVSIQNSGAATTDKEDVPKKKTSEIENNVIDTINNLIKTFPRDPLITSYKSPNTLPTTTPPKVDWKTISSYDDNKYYSSKLSSGFSNKKSNNYQSKYNSIYSKDNVKKNLFKHKTTEKNKVTTTKKEQVTKKPYQTTVPSTTKRTGYKVTASSIRDKHNNYYTIEISDDQQATDLSIFKFLKDIVRNQ